MQPRAIGQESRQKNDSTPPSKRGPDGRPNRRPGIKHVALTVAASGRIVSRRVEDDIPGMRSAGSQRWAGVLNSHFWFDPKADAMGLLMTQSLPFVEPRFMAT